MNDPRLGNWVKKCAPQDGTERNAWVLHGYPDDLGIKLNNGRPGAALGPDRIRHFLYKLTPPAKTSSPIAFWDMGDLEVNSLSVNSEKETLQIRHNAAVAKAAGVLESGHRLISLGGGHDYGFADGIAFLDAYSKGATKPLIINFDAHLDVRPSEPVDHSGTPFRRLLESGLPFDLLQIGIQSHCSARDHHEYCRAKGVHILTAEEIHWDPQASTTSIIKFTAPHLSPKRPVFLSIDIDGFSSQLAPGASQSWPTGISIHDALSWMTYVLKNSDVRTVGIYEVAPPLDVADQTSKLAAILIHRILFADKI